MKAVNLVPAERRRGGVGAGRSGGLVYALLAGLAVLVLGVGGYVLAGNGVAQRKSELARVTREVSSAQAQLAATRPYNSFSALRLARVTTITQLTNSRFSWRTALDQLSRVLPGNVWLTSVVGTVQPGVNVQGASGGGGTSTIRTTQPVPALELMGCTTSQSEVSRLMSQLRLMDGVSRVSLASSDKTDAATGGGSSAAAAAPAAGAASGGDCRHGSSKVPQFQLVVFFGSAPAAAAATVATPGPAPTRATR